MRQRISDKNVFPVFSLEAEYRKLHTLFFDRSEFGLLVGPVHSSRARPSLSYNDCLREMILDWKLRGTFTSIEEMLFGLHISEDDFDESVTEERLLDYIQFVSNAACFVCDQVKSRKYIIYQASDTIFKAISENAHSILDKLGAELVDCGGELYVKYKDDISEAIVAENHELEIPITEYLKIDNRGDLQRKGEVLCTLAKKLEPHEKALIGTEFKQLCTDTTFLLNNIGARHYQNPENKINAQFINMSSKKLEEWYDKAFRMFLACMAVLPYISHKSDIKELRNPHD